MGDVAALNRLSELGITVRTDGQQDYSSACPEYGILTSYLNDIFGFVMIKASMPK